MNIKEEEKLLDVLTGLLGITAGVQKGLIAEQQTHPEAELLKLHNESEVKQTIINILLD